MPLGTDPCKTAILQGKILAMHSSVAVGLESKTVEMGCAGRRQTVGCISGERFPFVLGGFSELSYFGVLMAAYSAAINWRRNPTMRKQNPYTVNGKAR
jgi:hypothetical protein